MDKNSDNSTTLIFKNIPKQIEDLSNLLNSLKIPAKQIKTFGRKRALITYELKSEAENAIDTIKELDFSGKSPNISIFCKEKPTEIATNKFIPKTRTTSNKSVQTLKDHKEVTPLQQKQQQQLTKYVQKLYAIEGDLNFDQPPPPYLKYNYPPINNDILDNICISLLSNKRFYTQVLHLMNRMNLEPPFAERKHKFKPPGKPKEVATQTEEVHIQEVVLVREEEKEIVESELESDDSDGKHKSSQIHIKRKLPPNEEQYKKKARQMLQNVQKFSKEIVKKPSNQPTSLTEIFEKRQSSNLGSKIEVKLKSSNTPTPSTSKSVEKLQIDLPKDLNTQKISLEDIQKLPIYKNYQIGSVSNKLYIKNLHKDVTSEDLIVLYQRFIKDDSIRLDIKVMQQGRMKGQAFVTFLGEKLEDINLSIAQALDTTNGFILRDKPMVVCYGKQS